MDTRSDSPPNELLCTECGYDLHMLTTPRCPECGAAFDPTATRRVRPVRPATGNTAAAFSALFACLNAWHAIAQAMTYAGATPSGFRCGCGWYYLEAGIVFVSIVTSVLSAIAWGVAARARSGVRVARMGFLVCVSVGVICMVLIDRV